ncbi:MAG: fumarylacetoacetate hydrolase family protein [Clostridia bacterium]|nr:fumarylacetoacetate hydrolase family protein [Clostridia bacterium]
MKLGRYLYNHEIYYGIFNEDYMIPIDLREEAFHKPVYHWDFEALMKWQKACEMKHFIKEVKLLSPMAEPVRNMFCLGKNYKDHALEMKGKTTDAVVIPNAPIYFSKACDAFLPPEGWVEGHLNVSNAVDYEVELAIIIKKEGKNINEEDAESYIFGYTIVNDLSARDLQVEHIQWHKGKSLDGFSPMGPVILLKESIAYPPALKIKSYVNDELRQDSVTDQLIFDLNRIISDLSKGMTLKPGDIILTGTPAGVGMGFDPPKYLKSNDKITCEIEKIGLLNNYIR